mgnify:CR=1 FL=1
MKSNIRAIARKISAFTLIELLIVIAIIAILTVVFLPTLRGGQSAARDAARKATVNDVVIGIEKIVNGDFVSASTSIAAIIPVSTGECLDFGADVAAGKPGVGKNIRMSLSKTPAIQANANFLCQGGFYYKTYESDGTTPEGSEIATNYVIIVQLEDAARGNVSGASITSVSTNEVMTGGAIYTAIGSAFDTFSNALTRTTGAATNPFYAVTK